MNEKLRENTKICGRYSKFKGTLEAVILLWKAMEQHYTETNLNKFAENASKREEIEV